jgi:methylated-DNA-protein-cysteine methyltransferase-like protein
MATKRAVIGPPDSSYARIYAVVRRIPRGRVATYGQVATLAGLHRAARLVGYALHASHEHHGLPWHRVLAAGGRLTLIKLDPDAALTQRIRLETEGVRFTARGTVDMERCAWKVAVDAKPRRKRVRRAR